MKSKSQMIEDLAKDMEYWEFEDVMNYAMEMYRSKLRGMTEEQVREEYLGIYGDDE